MIYKLRMKLVGVSMLSLMMVLLAVMGTANIVNYVQIAQDADSILQVLADNGGSFPTTGALEKLSSEIPYEARYFTVYEEDGSLLADLGNIGTVSEDEAYAYARIVLQSRGSRGFLGVFRYMRAETEEGGTMVLFLSCYRSLENFHSFLAAGAVIAAVGLAAVLALLLFFSEQIVRPIADSYEKQRRFITDAGHELKTPLTIIEADAEVLEMEQGENEWIEDIKRQTGRLAALTNDLIFLSRMEEAGSQLQMLPFPISEMAQTVVDSFQTMAKATGKTLKSEIKSLVTAEGDEKALRQLITVLLDNAMKYSPEGGEIRFSLEQTGKAVRLQVINDAESVDKEQMKHIFERFYRGDSSRNSRTGGYGIGMSIAKAVVTAHKGRITASSPDGRSMVITVLLPLARQGRTV